MTTLRQSLRNIYEIWAGSEGIPVPETAVEAYLLRLIEQMRDEASQALAEPEQECVAWMFADDYERMRKSETYCEVYSVKVCNPDRGATDIELYTAPPHREWVGLTEDDIDEIRQQCGITHHAIKTIEAKLKEKNT